MQNYYKRFSQLFFRSILCILFAFRLNRPPLKSRRVRLCLCLAIKSMHPYVVGPVQQQQLQSFITSESPIDNLCKTLGGTLRVPGRFMNLFSWFNFICNDTLQCSTSVRCFTTFLSPHFLPSRLVSHREIPWTMSLMKRVIRWKQLAVRFTIISNSIFDLDRTNYCAFLWLDRDQPINACLPQHSSGCLGDRHLCNKTLVRVVCRFKGKTIDNSS